MNVIGLKKGINGNLLKILALIFMTVDHAGLMLFHNDYTMRAIGRIAFPLFAYMIAEGCFYTRHPYRRLLIIFTLGVIFQVVFYIFEKDLEMSVFITFSFSILIINSIRLAINKDKKFIIAVVLALILSAFCALQLPKMIHGFYIDYGISGILLPVFIYLPKKRLYKFIAFSLGTALVALESMLGSSSYGRFRYLQWWSMLSLIFVFFYNGEKGKLKLKYFFYIYYPLHMVIIYYISELM